ncbi:MAG TPA: hypothetical protein VHU41_03385 [Thermoanaerobaculia bacterium]|nr:hypothetical protein [Thermoanaerobaculia bacterium]
MSHIVQIRDSVVAHLSTLSCVAASRACVPWKMLKLVAKKEPAGAYDIRPETLPDVYPGCVTAVDDTSIDAISVKQAWGESDTIYEVPVTIAYYATSDGATLTGAQDAAFEGAEAIHSDLALFTPDGALGPMKPGAMNGIAAGTNTHGVLLDFTVRFEIQVRQP